ncbi:MAG TPA: HEAT repeat domain-containing protein [Phycisphaerales bacterium]|nr:HEAT repeat domain-containing protein [Phycisphaerales bacterium]
MRRGDNELWPRLLLDFDYRNIPESGRFERWIARGIRESLSPEGRFHCAHFGGACSRQVVTTALLQGAADTNEHPLVRGQCLESLTHKPDWSRRASRRDKKIHRVVLDCLSDPDANVRFWACFAASGMKLKSAQHLLRQMTRDPELGDMGWTVGYEAQEALKSIQGKQAWQDEPPHRKSPYPPLVYR